MTYSNEDIEKSFPFADLEGTEAEIKLAHQIRLAYIRYQLDKSVPYINLYDIKLTNSSIWNENYSWLLKDK